jgi:hypothetical protein
MRRFMAFARMGPSRILGRTLPIRTRIGFGAHIVEATMMASATRPRPGFERAAEGPLGARE